MKIMKDRDYKLFEKLVSLTEQEMLYSMAQFFKTKYKNKVEITKEYIIAHGDLPIALVAHMDTVFKTPVSDLYYDERKGVLWSPEGLGADDRAGIFAILKIIQSGLRPSVILTTGEEMGGIGACALVAAHPTCPFPGLKYLIQLDRRGTNDCVFYDCYCPDFVDYVESFGFCEHYGSFSDISFLMPEWQIVGVNLSVGYQDEHSKTEVLYINALYDTIAKVKRMLQEQNIPTFKYDEQVSIKQSAWWNSHNTFGQHCGKCKKLFSEYELFPVFCADRRIKYFCPNCIANVDWCSRCGEAFEIDLGKNKMCEMCVEEVCTEKSKDNSQT